MFKTFAIFVYSLTIPFNAAATQENLEAYKLFSTGSVRNESVIFNGIKLTKDSFSNWNGSIIKFFPLISIESQPMTGNSPGQEAYNTISERVLFNDVKQKLKHYGYILAGPFWFFIGFVVGGGPAWSPYYKKPNDRVEERGGDD